MKIAIISTTVFKLPLENYGGSEMIVTEGAKELARQGHQVAVVAPEGSNLGPDIEIIPVALRESEEAAWARYRARLADQDAAKRFDIIWDHTFSSFIYLDSIGVEPPLPIVKTFHTSPLVWDSLPPVAKPCLVGVSRSHARDLALRFGVTVEAALNGIDTTYYKPPAAPEVAEGAEPGPVPRRNGRLLYVGRFMGEKGVLDAMLLCKRLRMPLDCYGDTELVSDPLYVERCRKETDGLLVRMFPNVTRAKLVEAYQTYKALLFTPVWCLTPDTLVMGNPSSSPIANLKPGDTVLNGEGKTVQVRWVGSKHFDGELVVATPRVLGVPVKMSPEHYVQVLDVPAWRRPSFFRNTQLEEEAQTRMRQYQAVRTMGRQHATLKTIHRATGIPETTIYYWNHDRSKPRPTRHTLRWKRAGELKPGDLVGFPLWQWDGAPQQYVDIPEVIREEHNIPGGFVHKMRLPTRVPITPHLLWLLGLYVAEGSARKNGISLSLGPKEGEIAERAASYLRECFNANAIVRPREHGIEVYVSSVQLQRLFSSWAGDGAWNKRLPEWAMKQPQEHVGALLRGLCEGDGYEVRPNGYINYGFSTVSKTLAFQFVSLLLRHNIVVSLRLKQQGPKAFGAGHTIYQLLISGNRVAFAALLKLAPPTGKQGGTWRSHGFFWDNRFWMRLRTVNREHYSGPVHDIQTDGSFVAGPMIVHNSEPFGLVPVEAAACGLPVVAIARGGVAETVKHEQTGYLCDDLQGVEAVLKSGCVARIKSEACVAWATENFSIPRMVARYTELFERVQQGHTW